MKIAVLTGIVVVALAGPVAAENWQPFSRSQTSAFMTDVDAIVTEGEVTSIPVATVARTGEAGDLSHTVETYQFQCGANRWRTAGMVEYGPDGVEMGRYPEDDAEWEGVRQNTMPGYLKEIACDGARAVPPHWPTIRAFIDAGRP